MKPSSTWFAGAMLACALALAISAQPARAENNLVGGISDIIGGALSIPLGAIAGTLSGPPIIGTVGGALAGAANTLSLTARGVLRLVGVAIPTAAQLAPLIPLFL